MGGFLTRDDLMGYAGPEPVTVELGDPVNATVKVLPMSGEGAAALQRAIAEKGEPAAFATAIAYCVASEDGQRMFTPGDVAALAKKPYPFLECLGNAVMANCGLATTVEGAEKN